MSKRADLLARIARTVAELAPDRIVRVAIDGVDGAGKTTFANELAGVMVDFGRPVIRASVDGFHNRRAIRYAKGRQSPIGFFEDSYNYALLKQYLLEPLSPGGNRRYCIASFDHVTDKPVDLVEREASSNSILLLDGIFLHRPELRPTGRHRSSFVSTFRYRWHAILLGMVSPRIRQTALTVDTSRASASI